MTCVFDVAAPLRLACVGKQTERAGATTACLLSRMAPRDPSRGLIPLSGHAVEAEDDRRTGFAWTGHRGRPTARLFGRRAGCGGGGCGRVLDGSGGGGRRGGVPTVGRAGGMRGIKGLWGGIRDFLGCQGVGK